MSKGIKDFMAKGMVGSFVLAVKVVIAVFMVINFTSCDWEDSPLNGDGDQTDNPTDGEGNDGLTEVLEITGSGFGTGPEVKFWFSGRNPEEKNEVDMTQDPEIGSFSGNREGSGSAISATWNYWYDQKSDRYFVPTINNSGEGGTYFSKNVDMGNANSEHDGYLISYRSYVPDGYSFPGTTMEQFDNGNFDDTGSTFKSAWVTNNGDNTGNGDLIIWTHSDGNNLQYAGNGAQVGINDRGSRYAGTMTLLNTRDHSNRVLSYLQVPEGFTSGEMVTAEWGLSGTNEPRYYEGQKELVSNAVPLNHRYISFTGWADPDRDGFGTIETTQVLYGDIYVAQGPNSRARVEIGDAANYADCKWLFIAPPTSWTDTEVKASFYADEMAKSNYWFVTTADGTRYSGELSK